MAFRKYAFYALLSAILLILALSFFYFLHTNYNALCTRLLTSINKLNRAEEFKQKYFTKKLFYSIRILSGVLLLMGVVAALFLKNRSYAAFNYLINSILYFLINVRSFFSNSFKGNKYLIIYAIILLVITCFNIFQQPIMYDEATTGIDYIRSGVIPSAIYYNAPNNHIFYNVLSSIIYKIPLDLKIESRIVDLLIIFSCFIILFRLLERYYGKNIALISTTLFCYCFPIMLYAFQARGYLMLTFFALIQIYSALKIISNATQNSRFYWMTFSLSSILGFYTMPSFLYPYVAINIFLLFCGGNSVGQIKTLIINNIIIGIIVLLLYTPVFVVNGVQAVTNNQYVQRQSLGIILNSMIPYLMGVYGWLMGINNNLGAIPAFILFVILLVNMLRHSDQHLKAIRILSIIFILSPFFILPIHRAIPFNRNWIYLVVPFIFCFSELLLSVSAVKSHLKLNFINSRMIAFMSSFLIILLGLFYFNEKVKIENSYTVDLANYSKIKLNDIKTIYSNNFLGETYMLFDIYRCDHRKHISISRNDSTISGNDVIILNSGTDPVLVNRIQKMNNYILLFSNYRMIVFVRNDLIKS